jgi:hypothetical protein
MKLFQKLLLAPAALGLMAPVAASASDLASAGGMNSYIQQNDLHNFRVWADQNQVTNVQQFNDVKPTDWAYQALSNLIERYGCVAGYPNGTFKGGQPMTRFEAAALLNACLDRITETTDEIQRLQQDFAKELSVLQGRVGKLEKQVGTLQSTQFSTTTKLEGDTYWTIGAPSFGNTGFSSGNTAANSNGFNNANYGAVTFNYDVRLNLRTSFTGKDLLYTRLRAGNYQQSAFAGSPYSLLALDRAFPGSNNSGFATTNGSFYLDRLYYRFPIGKAFTAAAGPMARNTEFLGTAPFYYTDHAGLDFFQLHGAPGTYNKATGGTFALIWKQPVKKGKPYVTVSTSLVSPGSNASDADGNYITANDNVIRAGGILGAYSADSWLTQVAYVKPQWKAAFAYRYGKCGGDSNYQNRRGSQAAVAAESCSGVNVSSSNFALSWAWQPKKTGTWVPALSLGYGYSAYNQTGVLTRTGSAFQALGATGTGNATGNIAATQSWTTTLQWSDAFVKGNSAGLGVGQPSFVTALRNGRTPQDGNYAWEWWYKIKMSDQISLTPTFFYLSNPSSAGQTSAGSASNPQGANVFGAFLAAQFKF